MQEDASKSYVKVNGWTGRSGDHLDLSVVNSTFGYIRDYGDKATGIGEKWVTNLAHESNIREVRMKMDSNYSLLPPWQASGVWSPDSGK